MADPRFNLPSLTIRRKTFSLMAIKFHLYGPNNELAFYSEMKPNQYKMDVHLYSGEDMKEELLTLKARNIINFSGTYDVIDTKTGEKVGALQRKGMQSMLRDEWAILDNNDLEIGQILEDNIVFALIRRYFSNLIPQTYDFNLKGTKVAAFTQNLNPMVEKISVDFSADTANLLDRRLGIAAGLLLAAVERRQN